MKKVRYIIAIISLLISLILAFFIFPRFQQYSYRKVFIVRTRKEIKLNQTITPDDVEYVEVVDHNLPQDVIKDINVVVGKVSPSHFPPHQWVWKYNFQETPQLSKQVTERLREGEQLMSIGIKERSRSLDHQIFSGDIISIYSENLDTETTEKLQSIEVFKVQTQEQQLIVTLIVKPEQARIIASLEAKNHIHLALKQRRSMEMK